MVPRVEQYQCRELSRMLDELSTKDGSSFMSSSMKLLSRAYRISASVPCGLLKFCSALNKRFNTVISYAKCNFFNRVASTFLKPTKVCLSSYSECNGPRRNATRCLRNLLIGHCVTTNVNDWQLFQGIDCTNGLSQSVVVEVRCLLSILILLYPNPANRKSFRDAVSQ